MIKKFESFENFYEEISDGEYESLLLKNNRVDIDPRIIDMIRDNIKVEIVSLKEYQAPAQAPWVSSNATKKRVEKGIYLSYKIPGLVYYTKRTSPAAVECEKCWIYELEDEWFTCNIIGKSKEKGKLFWRSKYKCDQLEGLTQLLKDLNIIK